MLVRAFCCLCIVYIASCRSILLGLRLRIIETFNIPKMAAIVVTTNAGGSVRVLANRCG